ncbi:MAG: HAD-IC family P-type ATPase, partial [Candidatus Competibacterales bacterium]
TPLATTAQDLEIAGKTVFFGAIDGRLAAALAVAAAPKASAAAAVTALKDLGLRVVMVTGDRAPTAKAVADSLGIHQVVAEVLPAAKGAAVQDLQGEGRRVAFVGDGINDAPALAQADVGISVARGTDIAKEAAEVVLMTEHLGKVGEAIALSKATLANIRQNLFWAFGYNVLLIPVAAGVLYPLWGVTLSPVFAAGAMAASSVCVLSNALRLRGFRAKPSATAAVEAPARDLQRA